jgi:hypothetical protein
MIVRATRTAGVVPGPAILYPFFWSVADLPDALRPSG